MLPKTIFSKTYRRHKEHNGRVKERAESVVKMLWENRPRIMEGLNSMELCTRVM